MPDATAPPMTDGRAVERVPLERLRSSRDIAAVMRARKRRAGEFAVLHVRVDGDADDRPVTRVAVVASRAVGDAVRRNRAKRLLREAARATSWVGGVDAVLVARPACATSGAAAVTDELGRLGSALGVTLPPVQAQRDLSS